MHHFSHAQRRPLLTLLCCALITASACATPPRSGPISARSARPSRAAELAHAPAYDTAPAGAFLRGEAADAALEAALQRAASSRSLRLDGRLAELALGIALDSDGAQRPPSYPLVSYHGQRAGIAEPTPQVWLASGGDVAQLVPALEQAVNDTTQSGKLTHLGAAAVYLDPAQPAAGVIIAVVLSSRQLSLRAAIPRSVAVGSTLQVAGELAAGYSDPVLVVTREAGITRSALGKARSFQRQVQAAHAGELTLELLASGPEGLTVVALMPVMVGSPARTEAPRFEDVAVEASAAEVAAKLLSLIAQERAQRKLPPLRLSKQLAAIALAHSEDMLAHGFVAHTSPSSGDATQRVQRAGLDALLVLENIGRGYSATELHRGLMESPGHRANILHPDARELGLGVVSEREGERDAFLVTQLFTQLAGKQ